MARFKRGEVSVLVATTVIEVGVDVPEASIMVVEHAERFGLAQLHQLRGRVGRGSARSSCMLIYQDPLGPTAKQRLAALRATDDGFVIAEEDLRLRGAGELLGTKQSGMPEFHFADLTVHAELLAAARDDARLILHKDPELKSPREKRCAALYLSNAMKPCAICARAEKFCLKHRQRGVKQGARVLESVTHHANRNDRVRLCRACIGSVFFRVRPRSVLCRQRSQKGRVA
jgi:superfamily II DNA or RNA helicase